jgi:hypothetical protein
MRLGTEQRDWLEETCRLYEASLMETPAALSYLDGRGLSEAIEPARIGFVSPDAPFQHQRYVGRLAIPYLKRCGVVGFKFRCIGDHACREEGHPKYLNDGPQEVWGILAIDNPTDEIDMCEGEIDGATLTYPLGLPAIGLPGAESWDHFSPIMVRLLKPFRLIRFWPDPDGPGMELAERVKRDLPKTVTIDLDQDVNESFRLKGRDYLLEKAGKL